MTDTLDERKTFVSAKGVTLVLRPVSQFKLDAIRTSAKEIPVPQYEMTVAGGGKVLHPMDEIIAKNQNRMDEWNQYQAEVRQQASLHASRFTELVVSEGVDLEVPGEDSEWQKNMEHFGIVVATGSIERKLQYIYSEALVGPEDMTALVSQILSVSQIPEEAIAKIRNSFRVAPQRDANRSTRKNKKQVEKQQSDV